MLLHLDYLHPCSNHSPRMTAWVSLAGSHCIQSEIEHEWHSGYDQVLLASEVLGLILCLFHSCDREGVSWQHGFPWWAPVSFTIVSNHLRLSMINQCGAVDMINHLSPLVLGLILGRLVPHVIERVTLDSVGGFPCGGGGAAVSSTNASIHLRLSMSCLSSAVDKINHLRCPGFDSRSDPLLLC
jgi:hypothetical protein